MKQRVRPRKWGWPFLAGIVVGVAGTKVSSEAPEPAPLPAPAAEVEATPLVVPETVVVVGPPLEEPVEHAEYGPPLEGRGPARVEGRIAKNERVADVLARAGASVLEIDRALATLSGRVDFTKTKIGDRYEVTMAPLGRIRRFVYQTSPLDTWVVELSGEAYEAKKVEVDVEREVALVEGEISSSLYDAFIEAGEKPALAMMLADVFRYDIDFNTETRRGDRFRLYVEKEIANGEAVGYGAVLAAEYGDKRLFRFGEDYYDASGRAARNAFLKSPLRFTRISSAFGYRKHPITKHRHFHGGVDYAAPSGTPVQSVADGVVTFAANKGANGNMVRVRHDGGYESYYLHLSKILVKRGQRVSQSSLVGRVGSTGRSTGPHLDFRLKRNGKYLDPTQKVVARHKTVPKRDRSRFDAYVARWGGRLDAPERLAMAVTRP